MRNFTERFPEQGRGEMPSRSWDSERPEKQAEQPEKHGSMEQGRGYDDSQRPAERGPEHQGKKDAEYEKAITREIFVDERQYLKDRLGWSDKKIDDNCRIDEKGTIHYKTDCQYMEGHRSECGVLYERRKIEYKGVQIEGVFPVFHSVFDTRILEKDYQSSSSKQFNEANKNLKEVVDKNPELKDKFTSEQLRDIKNGDTPRGYTWHHNEEPGKMQLVETKDHDKRIGGAAHTGGNSIWGNKSVDRVGYDGRKGESF